MFKKFQYILEALGIFLLMAFFKALPVKAASNIGGRIGEKIGPHLPSHQTALKNLSFVFPAKSSHECEKIAQRMWEHLGRVIAEYPHLSYIAEHNTQITITPELEKLLHSRRTAIFITAHFGGWEILPQAVLLQLNCAIDISYRAPNNPWVDKILLKIRTQGGKIKAYAKSREGGRDMMNAVKQGHSLGILIDQKYNQGLPIPFFGKKAMTNPFFAQLAQKYDCPIIPVHVIRLNGPNFQLSAAEAIPSKNDDHQNRKIEDVIKDAHLVLEKWITDRPEQWLWLHKRWPKEEE